MFSGFTLKKSGTKFESIYLLQLLNIYNVKKIFFKKIFSQLITFLFLPEYKVVLFIKTTF